MIDPPKVLVRIGGGAAFEMPWQIASGRQAIIVTHAQARSFVTSLLDKDELRFRLEIRGETFGAGFKIAGLREALATSPAHCGP